MRTKILLCSLALLCCFSSCTQSPDTISERQILKAVNTYLSEEGIDKYCEDLYIGKYECDDPEMRLKLRALDAAGILKYNVQRYAWWEKGQKKVRESYQVNRNYGWWSYPETEYRTVSRTAYTFEDHYIVDIKLTHSSKSLLMEEEDDIDVDEDLEQPDFSNKKYAWNKKDLSETWPVIENPFIEKPKEESKAEKATPKAEPREEQHTEVAKAPAGPKVERIDSLQYEAFSAISEDKECVFLHAYSKVACKARNIQVVSNDSGQFAYAEVIIKTDKVSDVGRIFNGVENGLKVLAKVKLIYYIDKGWVVEDCDL